MSAEEKRIAEKLANACEQLPPGKKEFLLGFAEGVAAIAEKCENREADRKLKHPARHYHISRL